MYYNTLCLKYFIGELAAAAATVEKMRVRPSYCKITRGVIFILKNP